jgi:hypothetical protein
MRAAGLALAAALWLATAGAALASAPRVPIMIVGKSRTLWPAHQVVAGRTSVGVGHRQCGVPRATPLAALVAARHAHGPGFHVHDYGACNRRADSGAGLFVDRVGPDRNRGHDGWYYKVARRAGSAGAANVAGPFGDGHGLRSGQRLLWFWCHFAHGSCQRTLESAVSTRHPGPGQTIRVTVRGYDDRAHGKLIAGATVRLGDAVATTGADGTAEVPAPVQPGRYEVRASRHGLVPAFPEAVRVG